MAPLFPPATGGSATYYRLLSDHLGNHPDVGRVTVLTSRWPGAPRRESMGDVEVVRRLPRLPFARTRAGWLAGEVLRIPASLVVTLAVAARSRSDIIHVHKTRSYGGAVLAGRLLRRPVVGDVRDLFDVDLFRMSNHLIACGQAAVEGLREAGIPEGNVTLVPIPVDLDPDVDRGEYEALQERLSRGGYILFVGDLTGPKGVQELLQAHRAMRREGSELDLVLVGKDLSGVQEAVGPEEGVHVTGALPHPRVLGLMERAEVLILPSRFELYPRVCVEGVMMGTRVVFPPGVPEFRDLVDDFVLPEVTPGAIRETLERVLATEDRPDYPLEDHDIGRITGDLVGIYRRLLGG